MSMRPYMEHQLSDESSDESASESAGAHGSIAAPMSGIHERREEVSVKSEPSSIELSPGPALPPPTQPTPQAGVSVTVAASMRDTHERREEVSVKSERLSIGLSPGPAVPSPTQPAPPAEVPTSVAVPMSDTYEPRQEPAVLPSLPAILSASTQHRSCSGVLHIPIVTTSGASSLSTPLRSDAAPTAAANIPSTGALTVVTTTDGPGVMTTEPLSDRPRTAEVQRWRHTSFKASAQASPCDEPDTPHVEMPLVTLQSSSATGEPIIHEQGPTVQADINATEPDHPSELRPYAGDEPAPAVTHPFEGLVGSQDGFADMCVTSPNATWIPQYPVERTIIKTYSDGRWGEREYSRWPQLLTPGMWHKACIPRVDSEEGRRLGAAVWRTLRPGDWEVDHRAAMPGLGKIRGQLIDTLEDAAQAAIMRLDMIAGQPARRLEYGRQLVLILLAAHVQRLCLEMAGLDVYLRVVLPRLESTLDYSTRVLEVLGAFPLSRDVKVWKVVPIRLVEEELSATPSAVPIHHLPTERVGAMNLTFNWDVQMVVAVSRELCAPTVEGLRTITAGQPQDGPESKRARVESLVGSKDLSLPVHARPQSKNASKTGGKKVHRGGQKPAPRDGQSSATPSGGSSSGAQHPSRTYTASPFYHLPHAWASALRDVGILKQSPAAVQYFYPPPYLLDTVPSSAALPNNAPNPTSVRRDDKVFRYLHNLVRIREFCRARLFDPTVDGKALSIAEWRSALWGDYTPKDAPPTRAKASEEKKAKRRHEDRNAIARLFGSVACLPPYDEAQVVTLDDMDVDKNFAAQSVMLRMRLIWEAHEINFRCDLVALDRAMVPRNEWPIMHRWQREADISAVWGQRSGIVTVLPHPREVTDFHWRRGSDPQWRECIPSLRAFITLMTRWDQVPANLCRAVRQEPWDVGLYTHVQEQAIRFYVENFVAHFHRLPVAPIMFPTAYLV
ncbi:hypothetical protein C8Q73DRAFT_796300 [Cubamyces lactineus]|nr:hypothetical protein C8Q73DRAFT_796300 [Cubamyces lactineus]